MPGVAVDVDIDRTAPLRLRRVIFRQMLGEGVGHCRCWGRRLCWIGLKILRVKGLVDRGAQSVEVPVTVEYVRIFFGEVPGWY